jgi:hypothetical protein
MRRLTFIDGADATRMKVASGDRRRESGKGAGGEQIGCCAAPSGLRITIRFLPGASRRAIKRRQPTRPAGSFASSGPCV